MATIDRFLKELIFACDAGMGSSSPLSPRSPRVTPLVRSAPQPPKMARHSGSDDD